MKPDAEPPGPQLIRSPSLRGAVIRECFSITNALNSGLEVERRAVIVSPSGDWRLPLPILPDDQLEPVITWALLSALSREFVLTLPGENFIAVIGIADSQAGGISIPRALPVAAECCSGFSLDPTQQTVLEGWLPPRAYQLSDRDAEVMRESFGPGRLWELSPITDSASSEPMRVQ